MTKSRIRIIPLFLIIGLLGFIQEVYAFCTPPGWTLTCYLDGKQGYKVCGSNGFFGPCIVPPDPPPPSGEIKPKYKILTTIYAPPGTQGGGSTSSVTYGSSSSAGTTVSASNAFKQSYSVTVTTKAGFLGSGGSVSGSFGYGRNSTDSEALDIKKTASLSINHRGPSVDGIDHNRDQIWLWLGPTVKLSMTPTAGEWTVDEDELMDIQYVYVGHLKDPTLMPPGVVDRLEAYGITTDDYAEILEANPFADDTLSLDTNRYKSLNTTFPYEPPFAPGDPVPTLSFTATYSQTNSTSSSVTNEYSTGMSVTGSASFIGLVETKIKVDGKWSWTDTDTRANSSGTSESASVTIGGPAFGYTGPTDMRVYYDVIYKTFAFAPIEAGFAPSLQGSLISRSKKALNGKEVIVVVDGVEYRTFTNAKGQYRIYGDVPKEGSLQFRVDGIKMEPVSQKKNIDIMLP